MTTTSRRVAYATPDGYYGEPDLVVMRIDTNPDGQEYDTEIAFVGPLAKGYDPDAVLAALGYERIGEWSTTDSGRACDVQPAA